MDAFRAAETGVDPHRAMRTLDEIKERMDGFGENHPPHVRRAITAGSVVVGLLVFLILNLVLSGPSNARPWSMAWTIGLLWHMLEAGGLAVAFVFIVIGVPVFGAIHAAHLIIETRRRWRQEDIDLQARMAAFDEHGMLRHGAGMSMEERVNYSLSIMQMRTAHGPLLPSGLQAFTWSPSDSHNDSHAWTGPKIDLRGGDPGAVPPALLGISMPPPEAISEYMTRNLLGPGQTIIYGIGTKEESDENGLLRHPSIENPSFVVAGQPNFGKSRVAAGLAAQIVLRNPGHKSVVVCDPHMGSERSIAPLVEPLKGAFWAPLAFTHEDVAKTVDAVYGEMQARIGNAEQHYRETGETPPRPADLVVLIDEWAALVKGAMGKELVWRVTEIARQGPKFGVTAVVMTQDASADGMGGNALRKAFAGSIVHRVRPEEASMALGGNPPPGVRQAVPMLSQGEAFIVIPSGFHRVKTPRVEIVDLEKVAVAAGVDAYAAPPALPEHSTITIRRCAVCGGDMTGKRADAEVCSDSCRTERHRQKTQSREG
jgi:hypothetical protein